MVILECDDAIAFDIKAGGPLELLLLPKGGDPETVALRGKDVSALLNGDEYAGPLRITVGHDGPKEVWTLATADGGEGGTEVHLTPPEMGMLRRAVTSRLWRMYQ